MYEQAKIGLRRWVGVEGSCWRAVYGIEDLRKHLPLLLMYYRTYTTHLFFARVFKLRVSKPYEGRIHDFKICKAEGSLPAVFNLGGFLLPRLPKRTFGYRNSSEEKVKKRSLSIFD